MSSWTQQFQAQFDEWTLLTDSTRARFSTLESIVAETNLHCDAYLASAACDSVLVTTAEEVVSTAKVAVSQFDTDSTDILSDFTASSAVKIRECDRQLQSDRDNSRSFTAEVAVKSDKIAAESVSN